eukprot:Selendium_serpulae@DN6008_c0_g1_i1.p1
MSTSRRFIILLLYGVAACAVAARTGGVKDSAAPGGSARGGSARAAAEADRRKLQRSRPTESPKEPTRIKTVMGYIHPRYLRKGEEAGFGAVGEASHLNIDWELYDIVAYAGFGVASDGSIHSQEYRTEFINEDTTVQQPAPMINTDPFTSGEMHLLYGELEYRDEIPPEYPWYEEDPDTGGWINWKNLLRGNLPVPLHVEGGAPGLFEKAEATQTLLLASIGGWSTAKHFPELISNTAMRDKFLSGLEDVMRLGFDGFDIDWNTPGYNGRTYEDDYSSLPELISAIRGRITHNRVPTTADGGSRSGGLKARSRGSRRCGRRTPIPTLRGDSEATAERRRADSRPTRIVIWIDV